MELAVSERRAIFGRRLRVAATVLTLLAGCSEEEGTSYDAGYDDGYATGYNTFCRIRMTVIWGKFDYPEYAKGYADGEVAGIADAKRLDCKA